MLTVDLQLNPPVPSEIGAGVVSFLGIFLSILRRVLDGELSEAFKCNFGAGGRSVGLGVFAGVLVVKASAGELSPLVDGSGVTDFAIGFSRDACDGDRDREDLDVPEGRGMLRWDVLEGSGCDGDFVIRSMVSRRDGRRLASS